MDSGKHRPNQKKESYAYEQWISGKHHAKLTSFIIVSFRLSSFLASVKQQQYHSMFASLLQCLNMFTMAWEKYQQQIVMKMQQTHVQSLFI